MNNDTTFDPSPLVPQLGEYILIPFVGFTLFGILASLGAYIRRQRTYLLGLRQRHQGAYSSSEQNYDSDEDRDEQEDLTEPLWKHEEEEPSAQTVMSHPAQDISANGRRGEAELGQCSTGAGSHCWKGNL